MKAISLSTACLILASSAFAQQGNGAPPVSPAPTPTSDKPVPLPLPVAKTNDADRLPEGHVLSERPATVVVKPSNPFSGFRKVDKNGDGTISMSELMNAFTKADENGDERLSLDEFQRGITDQPLDEGGVPDEPRIIIQQVEEKAPVESKPNAKPRQDTNTKPSVRRPASRVGDDEEDGNDADLDVTPNDGRDQRNSDNPRGEAEPADEGKSDRQGEESVDPATKEAQDQKTGGSKEESKADPERPGQGSGSSGANGDNNR